MSIDNLVTPERVVPLGTLRNSMGEVELYYDEANREVLRAYCFAGFVPETIHTGFLPTEYSCEELQVFIDVNYYPSCERATVEHIVWEGETCFQPSWDITTNSYVCDEADFKVEYIQRCKGVNITQ